ncbi:hypothetical protein ABIB82_000039 [Bradyrhizobium sp. i1.8.4]|uniref:hypothetical protein n=1 Tax=unclassified Bradyrhizobium TaxID=2631580 RepID=UPI003D20784B
MNDAAVFASKCLQLSEYLATHKLVARLRRFAAVEAGIGLPDLLGALRIPESPARSI